MGLLDNLKFTSDSDPEIDPESGPLFVQDPEPGERPAARKSSGRKVAPAKRTTPGTAKLAKEVAEDLTTLLAGTAAVWGLTDQCCAPVLEEQAKPIADALTAILARNPRLLAKFADTDIAVYTVQTIALGRALLPVGKAVYQNHVSRAVDDEESHNHDNGSVHLGQFPAFSGGPIRSRVNST